MGLRRSGKTTLLRRILTPRPDRLVCVDTLGELAARQFAHYATLDTFTATLLTEERYAVAVQPSDFEDFQYVCDGAAARRDVTLAIDEIDMWLPHNAMLPPQGVLNIALTGGHFGQSLIAVTHRPVTIHKSIMSQGTLWIFPMVDVRDCETVRNNTRRLSCPSGIDPSELEILRTDERGWIEAVQIARVTPTDVQVLAFDLQTGKLTEA